MPSSVLSPQEPTAFMILVCSYVIMWNFGVMDSFGKLQTQQKLARSTHACTEVEHSLARKPIAEADCSNFMDSDFVLAHSSCWLVQLPHEPELVEQLAISR
jgi:hypothetical protein